MWYGTKSDFVEAVCRDGPRSFRATDPSYFGAGSYAAVEANYAGLYSEIGDRVKPGRHTIVLYACSVSMVRVITLAKDYKGSATGFSQFYPVSGNPQHAVTLSQKCDAHFIPTKDYKKTHPVTGAVLAKSVSYQAVAEGPLAEGHEMVFLSSWQLVPVATVEFEW